jgi:hypothetical protein
VPAGAVICTRFPRRLKPGGAAPTGVVSRIVTSPPAPPAGVVTAVSTTSVAVAPSPSPASVETVVAGPTFSIATSSA